MHDYLSLTMKSIYVSLLCVSFSVITRAQIIYTHAGSGGAAGLVNGAATISKFSSPSSVATHTNGDVFVADRQNHCIRKISGGIVTTFAGSGVAGNTDGNGTSASFDKPSKLTIDNSGNLYVAATDRVRKITPAGVVSTFISPSAFAAALFVNARISEIDFDRSANVLWIADSSAVFLKANAAGAVSTTGIGTQGIVKSIWANHAANGCYYTSSNGNIYKVSSSGSTSIFANGAQGEGLAFNTANNFLYVATGAPNTHKITIYDASGIPVRAQFSGNAGDVDGVASSAMCNSLSDVFITPSFSTSIYVADKLNHKIRRIEQSYTPIPVNAPAAISPTTICEGSTFQQSVSSTSATHYNWAINHLALSNTGNVSGANTNTLTITAINPAQQGTFAVHYGNSYSNDSLLFSVSVNTLATVSVTSTNTLLCLGSTAELTASNNASGFGNYQWTSSTGASMAGNPKLVTPTVTTTYSVSGNDGDCPFANTATVTIVVSSCTSVNEPDRTGLPLSVYPNPANDVITIENRDVTGGPLHVLNALGELVVIETRSGYAHTIDISNLSAGVYFVRIENAHGTTTGKFIKH